MKITAWTGKISSKLACLNECSAATLVKSQWQWTAGVSVYYLIYRWVMACSFLAILVLSLVDMGRPRDSLEYYAKWPIYLTHWGITLCTIQAAMAAYLVSRAYCSKQDLDNMQMTYGDRMYWILYTSSTIGAFTISAIYWLFVYDPEIHTLDALNLLVHAANSILMGTDLLIVLQTVPLIYFYWPLVFSVLYIIFSYVYFLAGGTDRNGRTYIYKILNWEKPGKTLVITQLCVVFVLVLHVVICVFSMLRHKSAQMCVMKTATITESRTSQLQGETNQIPIDDSFV